MKIEFIENIKYLFFSNLYIIIKKTLTFIVLLSLIWIGHNYTQRLLDTPSELKIHMEKSFVNCVVTEVTHNFVRIIDDDNKEYLVDVKGAFKEIGIEKDDRISFIGMITDIEKEGLIVIKVIDKYYNHKFRALKIYISILPAFVIVFLLFKNRNQYFGK